MTTTGTLCNDFAVLELSDCERGQPDSMVQRGLPCRLGPSVYAISLKGRKPWNPRRFWGF